MPFCSSAIAQVLPHCAADCIDGSMMRAVEKHTQQIKENLTWQMPFQAQTEERLKNMDDIKM
jgi:hypothetical protein